jgi:hypothetical protein
MSAQLYKMSWACIHMEFHISTATASVPSPCLRTSQLLGWILAGSLQEGQNRALAAVQEQLDAAHTDLLSARKRHEDDLRQRNNRIEV